MQRKQQFHVIYRPEPEGGFTVLVPALPGCITFGTTLPKAQKAAADAIETYLVSLKKHNEPVPTDTDSFMGLIEVPEERTSTVHA